MAINLIKMIASRERFGLGNLDRHQRDDTLPFRIELDLPVPEGPNYSYFAKYYDFMTFQIEATPEGTTRWSQQTLQNGRDWEVYFEWWKSITGFHSGGYRREGVINEINMRISDYLTDSAESLSRVITIPEFRQIRDTRGEYNINGENLVR